MKQRTRLLHGGDDLIVYNMSSNKKNDDDGDEIQLHKIKPQEHFIEAQVQEGDTLQAIALRFYCSISELKRINHIHKDNEIFARRTIKVPVTPYSVLTELIPSPRASEPEASTSNHTTVHTTLQDLLQNNVHNGFPQHSNVQNKNTEIKEDKDYAIDCNAVVMNSTLTPSVIPYTDTDPNEMLSEEARLLPNKEKVSVEAVVVKELTSHGADFGLKWFHLVCFILILAVVVPLVYVMFYLDKHEHSDVPPLHST